jgi:hypothetical protein
VFETLSQKTIKLEREKENRKNRISDQTSENSLRQMKGKKLEQKSF